MINEKDFYSVWTKMSDAEKLHLSGLKLSGVHEHLARGGMHIILSANTLSKIEAFQEKMKNKYEKIIA